MASGITLATTYPQILQAAQDYGALPDRYNDSYREIYQSNFRSNIANFGDVADMQTLVIFLNKWRCRLSREKTPAIFKFSVPEAASALEPLAGCSLGDDGVGVTAFRAVETAFDRLIQDKGIAATAASKILAVINPEFFVAWDRPIQRVINGSRKCDGRVYADFMRDMQKSAQTVLDDASKRGIENPAAAISQAINQHPPFTLAHFINNFVWLTVTRGYIYASSH